MKPLVIVMLMVVLLGVGIYIGTSGLVTQYAVVPGRSSAGTAICAPDTDTALKGASVRFTSSNLPANTLFHWSSDEGTATTGTSAFTVKFTTAGTKTVSLFYFDKNVWLRTTCEVQIR
jgi:hypothetical protein